MGDITVILFIIALVKGNYLVALLIGIVAWGFITE